VSLSLVDLDAQVKVCSKETQS